MGKSDIRSRVRDTGHFAVFDRLHAQTVAATPLAFDQHERQ